MNIKTKLLYLILMSFLTTGILSSQNKPVVYLDPLPNAKYINKETTIIIKPHFKPSQNLINQKGIVTANATKSGFHKGKLVLSTDGKTIIFKPNEPFVLSDTVYVKLSSKLTKNSKPYCFHFIIRSREVTNYKSYNDESEFTNVFSGDIYGLNNFNAGSDSLPANFPPITITNSIAPSPGYIFLAAMPSSPFYSPYIMILDNFGNPVFYRQMNRTCLDFKKQSNGHFTYFMRLRNKFYELNQSYQLIDSFTCGNNYTTSSHEFQLLNDGSAYLKGLDPQIVNMSYIVPGGDTAAVVEGNIIQQLDSNKNVIFQWRTWDHYQITDAVHINLTSPDIDYAHINAIEIDNDDNIMVSARNMDEVTKIDRESGDIIWRMGGKNNQFTFINDTIGFCAQHDIRRIQNGNITLLDNGNYHTPKVTRAVEYILDEQNKTATLVWQYKNNPVIFSSFMGNVQRLDNGNTIIGWGGITPTLSEVKSDGTKVFQLTFPQYVYSYRAFRFDLTTTSVKRNIKDVDFSLKQNYPNPFNAKTKLEFSIAKAGFVSLKIYDVSGSEISNLVSRYLEPSNYSYTWDASNYASGIYFYKLKVDNFSKTGKMILQK